MKPADAVSLEDFEEIGRKRLPRFLFEMIQGGVEDETGITRNRAAFDRWNFNTRFCEDVANRTQSTNLFGKEYSSPFGICPMGAGDLFRRGFDRILAQTAEAAGIPYVMSGASMALPEDIRTYAPENFWMQLYPSRDSAITMDMIRRTEEMDVNVLVVTVDTPVLPKRERGLRSQLGLPLRKSPVLLGKLALQGLSRPRWLFDYLSHGGLPTMHNWAPYAPKGANAEEVTLYYRSQSPSVQTWESLKQIRDSWSGKLVIKGIASVPDCEAAVALGADGIILSNHGGKVFDRMPSPVTMLPLVKEAIKDRAVIMIDSGFRRGSDVVAALALGASFVFVGRPFYYAAASVGLPATQRVVSILKEEIDIIMAMTGCARIDQINRDILI